MRLGQPEWNPVECIADHMAKAMAGAPRRLHVDARRLREALQAGSGLTPRQRGALNDMVASCKMWEMHVPFTAWGLSIYQLARVVTVNYDGEHTWASWLNLWADNPERILPAPARLAPWNPETHPPFCPE